ncbi:TlpA disulfide reductase family protein [Aestuariivivens marinum]|uniref:TlpA disulfide reductase family protein n=1 Tax=Aestuariivivens marinum TaxID=2913555 RepID=UPI001F582930|nr:TlpA disulfide reductase family protein [Aestuariivivens marinum]
MTYYRILFLCFFISIFGTESINAQDETAIKTIIKGEVFNRPQSKNLLLVKAFDDARFDKIATISIVNGKFDYTLSSNEVQAYKLIFEEEFYAGAMKPITFFAEDDVLVMKLHDSENFLENKIEGGVLNSTFNKFNEKTNAVFYSKYMAIEEEYKDIPREKLFSETYHKIIQKLKDAKSHEEKIPIYKEMENLQSSGLDKSELGEEKYAKSKRLFDAYLKDKYHYIKSNLDMVSLYMVIDDLMGIKYNNVDISLIRNAFKKLSEAFPNHSYTNLGASLLHALNDLKPGGQYVNFIAPDINGNMFELNSILKKNKVVLLDLWATWCGPCIAKTRLVKPVYEKYKDKGFTILGVAGEYKTLDRYNKFMEKEQWEWQQLIELNKQNSIWEKYNVMNGGGGMFLIASTGEILAVNPSAEEVEAILEKQL